MKSKEQIEKFIKEKKESIIIKKTKINKSVVINKKEIFDQLLIQMLIDFGYVEDDK